MFDSRPFRWLDSVKTSSGKKKPSAGTLLSIEALEARLTPASVTIPRVFSLAQLDAKSLQEPSSITPTAVLSSTNVTFTSANPADPLYSGNNVPGTIGYDPGSITISGGVASRLVKVGSSVKGIYVYGGTTAGSASYLLELESGYFSTLNIGYSTSSDPVDGALNKYLATQAPAPGIAAQVQISSIVDDVPSVIGIVPTGGQTNDADIDIFGTVSVALGAGETLNVYRNGVLDGIASVNADLTWSYTPSTLSDGGPYSFAARVENTTSALSGAFSNGYEVSVIDTTAPSAPTFSSIGDDTNIPTDRITSDRTLTVTGTAGSAEAGSTVKLYDYTNPSLPVFLGSAVVASDGSYSVVTSSLPDGVYPLRITATDVAGNESLPTNLNTWTIDGTAPSAPNFSSVSDDTNIPTDRITSDRTLTVTGAPGSAEAGSTVKLYDYTDPLLPVFLGSAVVAADGSYSVTTSSLADGVYPLKITATDVAGNESAARSLGTWTIDGTAPSAPGFTTVSEDTNIPTDRVTSDRTLTVTGAPGSALPGSTVNVYDNSTGSPVLLGSAVVNPDGSYSVTTSSLPDGSYPLGITATDLAGNESAQTSLGTWTIDGAAPSAPNFSSISEDTNITTDRITNDRTLTVTGTAGSAEAGSTVKLYDYTNPSLPVFLGSAVVASDGSYSVVTSSLPDGVYPLRVTATDVAGNESLPTNLNTWTIDGTAASAPNFSSVSDDTNIPTDRITNDRTLTVTGAPGSAEAGSTVKLYDYTDPLSPVFLGSAVVAADGSYSVTTSSLADGVYPLKITATDVAGNESGARNLGTWTIDGTAPSAPGFSSVSDDTNVPTDRNTSDRTLNVTGVPGSAEPRSTVKLYDYTNPASPVFLGLAAVNSDGSYSVTTSSLPDGVYPLRITATDVAGNESLPTNLGDWTIDGTSPAAPTASNVSQDTGASPSDLLTNDNTLTVTGTAEPNSLVTIYDNGVPVGTGMADANGDFSITTSVLADGQHPLTMTATDLAGNVSLPAALGTWTIDTIAPLAPSITSVGDDTGIPGDGITTDTTPTVDGLAEPGSTVDVYVDGVLIGSTTADPNTGAWSITFPALPLGNHSITATATDLAGNTGPACAPTVISIVPPFGSARLLQTLTMRVGTTGSLQLQTVNGAGPLSFALLSGALPTGLRLSSLRGIISGVPTNVETRGVTVRATDAHGHTADISVNIQVLAAFKPYLVAAGIGATNNVGTLPRQLINRTTYANGTAVALYDGTDNTARAQYVPFVGYRGEVRVALDDVNNDGRMDVLAVPAAGGAPVIRMMDVQTGATVRTFRAFSLSYLGGAFLTTGDVNNDGVRDIIASTGGGTQPRIVAFNGATGAKLLDFTPFGSGFSAGVTVAVTDTNGDNSNEIIVGSGVGDRALIRIFDTVGLGLIRQFAPFGATSRVGVSVAAGDIDNDGLSEIVAATMSAESRVTIWNAQSFRLKDNFFAYGQNDGQTPFPGGVRVAVEDYNRQGRGVLITGAGPLGFPHVRVWKVINGKTRAIASFIAAEASDNRGINIG